MARNAYTGFKRKRKPTGARGRMHPTEYECTTCGAEPYQCESCGAFTCHKCAARNKRPLKCDHCQTPLGGWYPKGARLGKPPPR